jgi:hypothetical protein
LCNTYDGSSEIKSSRKDTYNIQYQTFSQKLGEYLDDCFARFQSIVSSLPSEYVDFATLDIEKIFSNLKSHELFRKGRPNNVLLLLVRLLLLVLELVAMMLTRPTPPSHLL